jgi:hypothetical protein
MSNATVAAGMITGRNPLTHLPVPEPLQASASRRVTPADQQSRAGHRVVTVWLEAPAELAHELERLLFDANCRVHALSAADAGSMLPQLTRTLNEAGVIALVYGPADPGLQECVAQSSERNFLRFEAPPSAGHIYGILQDEGIISQFGQGD